jgi:hypothetical protein
MLLAIALLGAGLLDLGSPVCVRDDRRFELKEVAKLLVGRPERSASSAAG